MSRYCVIGAGAAGISALQQLREAGYEAECFEKTDRVGGHWHTDYEALHLITSRNMTHFEGFPMPEEYPHFPRRDQVRSYIESYADRHGHYDLINFNTEVISVTPVDAGSAPVGSAGWRVLTSRGDEGVFDGVLVANGHLWDAHVPNIPGEFTGKQLHSSEYNNVQDLDGGRVLVVGAGNSGCDLAVDVAQNRLEVDIVVREGRHFQPKMYFGVPRQEVPFLAGFSPEEQDLLSRLLARVSIGENHNYPGMPVPQEQTLAGAPVTVNDLLLYWIHHGRVRVVPGISHFDGRTVHFTDGSCREYDSILWATGFNVKLPFLGDDQIAWRRASPRATCGRNPAGGGREAVLRGPHRSQGAPDPDLRRSNQVDCSDDQALRGGRVARLRAVQLLRHPAGARTPHRHCATCLARADGRHRTAADSARGSADGTDGTLPRRDRELMVVSLGTGLAVVTGASSGMGECTASELLKRGWTVIAVDRATPTLTQAEDRLRCVGADVTDRSGLQAALDAALRPGESIALVANVAGVYPPSTLSDYTEALYRHVFDVNVLGVLNVISAAVPHMEAGSSIVNFASVDAFAVSPGQLLYGASKAAVVMLTKELALELAPQGIRVNGVAPGWVDTPGNQATGRMQAAAASIPLGRVAAPEEIAKWVIILAGEDASFMTGETVVLSGGDVLR